MLDDATVLDSEQVIVRRRGHSPGFDYSEDEVTLRDVSARDEHGSCARLCHSRYPSLKPRNPVTDLGPMLKVGTVVDELIGAVKQHIYAHHLFEFAQYAANCLRP